MRLLYLLFILLFTSCGVGFQYTTLNHAGHIDGIYSSNDYNNDFDGSGKTGPLPTGTYFWVVNRSDGMQYKGTLLIMNN